MALSSSWNRFRSWLFKKSSALCRSSKFYCNWSNSFKHTWNEKSLQLGQIFPARKFYSNRFSESRSQSIPQSWNHMAQKCEKKFKFILSWIEKENFTSWFWFPFWIKIFIILVLNYNFKKIHILILSYILNIIFLNLILTHVEFFLSTFWHFGFNRFLFKVSPWSRLCNLNMW